MRVVAGTHRGRTLRAARGLDTRPITDRVKVNLFNILGRRVVNAVVADCFCGTGSLGIECLSRGADHVTFVEVGAAALRLLRENLRELGLAEQAAVVRQDVLRKGLPLPPAALGPFTLVFLDPPYRLTETAGARLWLKLCQADEAGALAGDVQVVWRHQEGVTLSPPGEADNAWTISARRVYGSQALTFVGRREGPLGQAQGMADQQQER